VQIGFFLLIGLLAVGAAYLAYYLRKKRREELAAIAFRLGLEFSADDPFGCLSYPFALLSKGDGRERRT
jgi:hypothetical protein